MTAKIGRAVILSIVDGTEFTVIAALNSKSITFNKEPVDITTDDDAGWRQLLEDVVGTKSLDIAFEGILKTNQVGLLAEADTVVRLHFNIPTIRSYEADFMVTSYEIGAETAEGTTFSASVQSSGVVTFAAAL
jgi:predicted secreted protein